MNYKARLYQYVRDNCHPEAGYSPKIGCMGPVAAGKSTFLGGIHSTLGYSKPEIEIKRGKARRRSGVVYNSLIGINRRNATVNRVFPF